MDQVPLLKSMRPGDPVGPGDLEEINLALRRLKMNQNIPFRVTVEWDEWLEIVVVRMVRTLAALQSKETITMPATWWDHLKLTLLQWMARRGQRFSQRPRWVVRKKQYRAYEYLPYIAISEDDRRASFVRWETQTPIREADDGARQMGR